jgi:hypothetical protein
MNENLYFMTIITELIKLLITHLIKPIFYLTALDLKMPAKKRTRAGQAGGAKKQKTAKGAKPSQPTIPIDEGFKDGGTCNQIPSQLTLDSCLTVSQATCTSILTMMGSYGMPL